MLRILSTKIDNFCKLCLSLPFNSPILCTITCTFFVFKTSITHSISMNVLMWKSFGKIFWLSETSSKTLVSLSEFSASIHIHLYVDRFYFLHVVHLQNGICCVITAFIWYSVQLQYVKMEKKRNLKIRWTLLSVEKVLLETASIHFNWIISLFEIEKQMHACGKIVCCWKFAVIWGWMLRFFDEIHQSMTISIEKFLGKNSILAALMLFLSLILLRIFPIGRLKYTCAFLLFSIHFFSL